MFGVDGKLKALAAKILDLKTDILPVKVVRRYPNILHQNNDGKRN